ncbi:MAG TPA: hypothetical protein IAB65_01875 [Candidatus Onthocola stercorigallinarum]|nr:hypothetical protein [Candidatus Onthocola stercorigallinarum]
MDTRMNKYDNKSFSRVAKNEELYKEINDASLDNFSVRSNATVIGNQDPEIDIEKIKKILDTKYNNAPKRKSIRIDIPEEEEEVDTEPTKEYDLNVVLEKAKDELPETYEEARAKKLRNTQFDILNNLHIEEDQEEEEPSKAEEDLMELINTISINEKKISEISEKLGQNHEEIKEQVTPEEKENDAFGILDELKGSDDTEVYESMTEEIKKVEEQDKLEETKKDDEEEKKENTIVEKVKDETMDSSFYTTSLFKKHDFADDEDDTDKGLNIVIKILIVLVIICFLVGIFLFVRSLIME